MTVCHPVSLAIAPVDDDNINRKCFSAKSLSPFIVSAHLRHVQPPLDVVDQLQPMALGNLSLVSDFLI
ncbi:hypothetical protein TorRG33x02_146530 [Trema orientale]|uniref:Uncharacterized protein n=1 Tax=Trema orientale TaxID=63057 RepID=A0A2P5EVD1_TREOI|nr:hypothetical protein TorRG33x02_146530 [Trema orientale]